MIPASMGLCLELAYPITSYSESRDSMDSAPLRHQLPLNSFIDSILRTVYHASAPPPDPHGARRQIIFTSSSPDACAAVNWKQPNCQFLAPPLFLFIAFWLLGERKNAETLMFPFLSPRSSAIRVIVRRSGRQPTEHHGNNTQRSDARHAFDEYQRGG
jgi:hypothetical protein